MHIETSVSGLRDIGPAYYVAIYASITAMARTTILLPDELLHEVKRVAETQGITMTEVIRTALRSHIDAQPAPRLPSFTAAGGSPHARPRKTSERAGSIAQKTVDPHEGSAREGQR